MTYDSSTTTAERKLKSPPGFWMLRRKLYDNLHRGTGYFQQLVYGITKNQGLVPTEFRVGARVNINRCAYNNGLTVCLISTTFHLPFIYDAVNNILNNDVYTIENSFASAPIDVTKIIDKNITDLIHSKKFLLPSAKRDLVPVYKQNFASLQKLQCKV